MMFKVLKSVSDSNMCHSINMWCYAVITAVGLATALAICCFAPSVSGLAWVWGPLAAYATRIFFEIKAQEEIGNSKK